MDGPRGRQIFTLQSADQPYRILAERMNEGAATLTAEGTILFCNHRLADMVDLPHEQLLGSNLTSILGNGGPQHFSGLVQRALESDVRQRASCCATTEVRLRYSCPSVRSRWKNTGKAYA